MFPLYTFLWAYMKMLSRCRDFEGLQANSYHNVRIDALLKETSQRRCHIFVGVGLLREAGNSLT